MALWVCGGEAGCGTKYAVGLSRCPRCHNTEFFEDGDPMAKISRLGGASVASPETADAAPGPPAEAVPAPQPVPADVTAEPEPEPKPEPVTGGSEEPTAEAELLVLPEAPGPEPRPGYEDWTVEELKAELAARGLPKSGKRDDLVQRLNDDDTVRGEQGAE